MARNRISDTDRKRDGTSDQVFMITDRRSGEIIGAIGLVCFTREHSRAKTGYWISADTRSLTRDMLWRWSVRCWITGSW